MTASEVAVARAVRAVRDAGGRATVALRCVVGALAQAESHRSAEDLAAAVRPKYPEINESTVYRTLERLESLGVTYHVHLGHGPAQWHLVSERPHQHLACRRCGRVIEVAEDVFTPLVRYLAEGYGFTADMEHFAISGTCSSCSTGPSG
ncbi:MAG: Fur family transcriptional regulator [Acidimicrobiales bacterium]